MIEMRNLCLGDSETVRRWRNKPEVARYMYNQHEIGVEEHERWFRHMLTDSSVRYWMIVCDGEDVGVANLVNIDQEARSCSWAFYLGSDTVRGRGLGRVVEWFVLNYVFEQMKFAELHCEVLTTNQPVINLHKTFGFRLNPEKTKHVSTEGKTYDIVALLMARADWEQNHASNEERLRNKGLLQPEMLHGQERP
jgi:UDP-4-amino-4,6-dideoxy-N-acetyl-beta-L-altrosamine N-acetyltransferase